MRGLRAVVVLSAVFLTVFGPLGVADSQSPDRANAVVSLRIDGVVDPFVANYVRDQISAAQDEAAAAVLITIDTPGGLDSSMREIVKAILASRISVICYTAPQGARAASAGTFVMYACPVNAMAPGTNIGAAHPVGVSGAIESEKVTNDAAAYIRSLAERWHRNTEFAEQSVVQAKSISAEEALQIGVVDYVSPSASDLLRQVGKCDAPAGTITDQPSALQHPSVCHAVLEPVGLGLGPSILHGLFSPDLAFLFFYLGLGLIVVELLHPGVSVPGILGGLFLIVAFVSFGLLPVNLAGVVALVLSALFFLIELKHPGFGLPTLGGLVFLILGGLLLFDRSVPGAQVSPWLIAVVAAVLALFFGFVVRAVVEARRLAAPAGQRSLLGAIGVAVSDLDPAGTVRVRQEEWSARSERQRIDGGTTVRVTRVDGLTLIVEPASESDEATPSAEGVGVS
jgi:membrane-bound serine protease (ClpP class)